MKKNSLCIRLSDSVLEALNRHFENGKFPAFIREAIAEKLNRDFGEAVDLTMRKGQGKRTDLERKMKLAKLAEQASKAEEARMKANPVKALKPDGTPKTSAEIKADGKKFYSRGLVLNEKEFHAKYALAVALAENGNSKVAEAIKEHNLAIKAYKAGEIDIYKLNAKAMAVFASAGIKFESDFFKFATQE